MSRLLVAALCWGRCAGSKSPPAVASTNGLTATSLREPSPSAADALVASGTALAAAGENKEAIAQLQAALELSPAHVPGHINLGLALEAMGLTMSAVERYVAAVEVAPSSAAAYQHLGTLLHDALGERSMGTEALQLSVQLDPSRAAGWTGLSRALHTQGELDQAAEALTRAVGLQPTDTDILANMATVLRALGRFDESRHHLLVATAVTPEGDHALAIAFTHPPLVPTPAATAEESAAGAAPAAFTGAVASSEALRVPPGAVPASLGPRWREALAAVRLSAVASGEECAWLTSVAEAHAAARGGWLEKGHHDAHPTKDVVVAESGPLREWLSARLRSHIWPALAAGFGAELSAGELWLEDAFVVKYEAGRQDRLGSHADDSELSFTILLSDPADFVGGGTTFEAAGATVRPARGQMVSHFGRLRHAGSPIQSGTRYILAGFVRVQPLAARWRELKAPHEPDDVEPARACTDGVIADNEG